MSKKWQALKKLNVYLKNIKLGQNKDNYPENSR